MENVFVQGDKVPWQAGVPLDPGSQPAQLYTREGFCLSGCFLAGYSISKHVRTEKILPCYLFRRSASRAASYGNHICIMGRIVFCMIRFSLTGAILSCISEGKGFGLILCIILFQPWPGCFIILSQARIKM